MQILSDLHIHTTLSSCCADPAQTPENILSLLSGRGFRKIAFTDHLWENPSVPPSPWYATQGSARILRMADSARKAAKEHSMTLLIACETDMCAPGKFGITPQIREKFDFVQMASDHFHMREFVEQPEEATPEKLAKHMMKFFRSAVLSGLADVLVHPMMPLGSEGIYDRTAELISDQEFLDAFALAAERGIGIEINAAILCANRMRKLYDPDSYLRVLSLARDAGCRFTFGSDSHSRLAFEQYALIGETADALSLTEEQIHPLARLPVLS